MIVSVSEFERIALGSIESEARAGGVLGGEPISVYPDVLAKGLVTIERHPDKERGGAIDDFVAPGQLVGLLPLAKDISLWVNPKVPVDNIDFMAKRYGTFLSPKIKEIRQYFLSEDTSVSLWEGLANALVSLSEQITVEGLWREYVQKDGSEGSFRGRIDPVKTVNLYSSRHIDYKVATTYFDREMDVAPNRVLRQALQTISQKSANEGPKRRARRVARAFQYVSPATKEDFSRLRDRSEEMSCSRPLYSRVLPIAEAVLFNEGLDSSSYAGWLDMDTLFINMGDLFENYIRTVLDSILDPPFEVKDGNTINPKIPLFEDGYGSLTMAVRAICTNDQVKTKKSSVAPDIMIERNGRIVLTPDVKYKPIRGAFSAKREDIEQSITYAQRLGLEVALTIHPCMEGKQKGLHYSGRVGSIQVFCYCINLGTRDLAAEERDLAKSIRALIQG